MFSYLLLPQVNVALPEDFLPVFSHLKIKKVIQLNEASYDKNIFEVGGVEHVKIIFPDCGTPSDVRKGEQSTIATDTISPPPSPS